MSIVYGFIIGYLLGRRAGWRAGLTYGYIDSIRRMAAIARTMNGEQ